MILITPDRSASWMQQILLSEEYIHGAVSIEQKELGLKPWRIPYEKATLFAEPLLEKAEMPAGVRVGLVSTTQLVQLVVEPSAVERAFDCVVNDELVETFILAPDSNEVCFTNLAPENKRIEIYLPPKAPVIICSLTIEDDAIYTPLIVDRPRMITYGSSITHAAGAASPAQTWPAIVARRQQLHLTSLGFGGQCHIEPMVACMIRDLPAAFISLCLGINVMGQSSLSERTFGSAVLGMVSIIREKHPRIPLVVQSPIYASERETVENRVGLTTVKMRAVILNVVTQLKTMGDTNLYYVDGLLIFGEEHKQYLVDKLHPSADGYRLIADNYERVVMQELGIGRMLQSEFNK
jgi:lysophospholipase L1-like esterase